jgi:DNA transformation protein
MFGGIGLYADGAFFGLVWRGALYFRVSDATRARYVDRRMPPFRPFADKQPMGGYYEVPAEFIEDDDDLTPWGREALDVARTSRTRPPNRQRKARS